MIQSDLPQSRKADLLTKYLEHPNLSVSSLAFVGLLQSGTWSAERAVSFVRSNKPTTSGWHTLLTYLPATAAGIIKQDVAREILMSSQRDRPSYAKWSPPRAETDAVRVLLTSRDERDLSLIRQAAQQYPETPLLWAAVGRLPPDEETLQLARQIYSDTTKPLPVRCSAALVFGKSDADVMHAVVRHLLPSVREFGSKEYMEWSHEGWARPADPARRERLLRAEQMEGFLAVAYEIPGQFLIPDLAEFVQYPYMTLGAGMCSVLARRLPREFVAAASHLDSVPREPYGPLLIAGRYQPAVVDQARRLLPNTENGRGVEPSDSQDSELLGLRTLTWWD